MLPSLAAGCTDFLQGGAKNGSLVAARSRKSGSRKVPLYSCSQLCRLISRILWPRLGGKFIMKSLLRSLDHTHIQTHRYTNCMKWWHLYSVLCKICCSFLANVNYMLSPVRLSSVTFVRPTQAVQIFGNISTVFGTLAIHWHPLKISRRSSQGNPSDGGVKHKRGIVKYSDFGPIDGYISETVQDRRQVSINHE